MDKMEYCKWAHEKKDEIMKMFMKEQPVTDTHIMHYLLFRAICEDNVMEATRKYAYMPANAKIAEADGIYTIHLDDKAGFAKAIKDQGKDLDNAVHHALEMVEEMRMIDPVRYSQFMAKLK